MKRRNPGNEVALSALLVPRVSPLHVPENEVADKADDAWDSCAGMMFVLRKQVNSFHSKVQRNLNRRQRQDPQGGSGVCLSRLKFLKLNGFYTAQFGGF